MQKEEITERIRLNWGIFVLGVLFVLGAIAGCVTLGVFVAIGKLKFGDNSVEKSMLIGVVVLMVGVFVVWLGRICFVVFVKSIVFVKEVLDK